MPIILLAKARTLWGYIRYADQSEELYDHETAPNEWNNLAARRVSPSHESTITRLKAHHLETNLPQRN